MSSVTRGMLLSVGGLAGAVLCGRSILSCRLRVWICFKAVSSLMNGDGSGVANTCCAIGAGCHL